MSSNPFLSKVDTLPSSKVSEIGQAYWDPILRKCRGNADLAYTEELSPAQPQHKHIGTGPQTSKQLRPGKDRGLLRPFRDGRR